MKPMDRPRVTGTGNWRDAIKPAKGPFAAHAAIMLQNGYSPVPVIPGTKSPFGTGWDRLRTTPYTLEEIEAEAKLRPAHGIGVMGCFGGMLPIDIDTDDEAINHAVCSVLPAPLVAKKGQKGYTTFLRAPDGWEFGTHCFRPPGANAPIVEVLGKGKTVLPPTVHPDIGKPYEWLTPATLFNTRIEELPRLTDDFMEALTAVLRPWCPEREVRPQRLSRLTIADVPSRRIESYALEALHRRASEIAALRGESGRNNALHKAVSRVGNWVHHGYLSESEMRETLRSAYESCGAMKDHGRHKFDGTVRSGMRMSANDPLWIPEGDDFLTKPSPAAVDVNSLRAEAARKAASNVIELRQLDDAHYTRKAEQRAENVKLVEDDLAGERITKTVTLDEMVADLVWLSAGRYTGRISDKRVMKSEDFAALLGASKTLIEPKSDRGQPKLVPTFSLWRESRERATVDAQTWLPEGPTFCPLPVPSANNGMQGFNTWAELPAYAAPENWLELSAPFREHLDYLCPVPAERDHFTMWLAHIFQCPGVLPHHFFCHVTTTHGIGRNWLASVLVRMLRRYVAPDLDMEQVLEGKYNDQMSKKLLLIFNEVYEPGGAARHRRGAKLRELVNPEYRHVNPKCERQHAEYNFARWLCFSNFEEAIAFDTEDNRLVLIENPRQRQADSYYERLYTAYKDPAFLASCRHWLQTIDISAFNPGRHAEVNDIKRRSLEAQTSPTDLAAQQFIDSWPGSWVGVKFFKTAVRRYLHDIDDVDKVEDKDVAYAMRRAGVVPTSRVMRLPDMEKIATVKGRCSQEFVEKAEAFELQKQWREWVAAFEMAKFSKWG